MSSFLRRWHKMLGLARQSPVWHRERLIEELEERRLAITWLHQISETADVIFTISRANYECSQIAQMPPHMTASWQGIVNHSYMLAKFTSRWAFYQTVAFLCGCAHYSSVREVVNPAKDSKLGQVAQRHNIDPDKFTRVAHKLLRVVRNIPCSLILIPA